MAKSFTIDEDGRQVNYIVSDDMANLFGDGFGPALIGFSNTKLTVFQQPISSDVNAMQRDIVATVTIPTVALVELGSHVKRVLQANREQLSADMDNHLRKLLDEA